MSDQLLNDDYFAKCPVPAFPGTIQFPDWTLPTYREWCVWVEENGRIVYPEADVLPVVMGDGIEGVDFSGVTIAVRFADIDIDHPKMPAKAEMTPDNIPVQVLPWLADCAKEWAVDGVSFFRHRPSRVGVPAGDEEE